jgi:hypothetical protein
VNILKNKIKNTVFWQKFRAYTQEIKIENEHKRYSVLYLKKYNIDYIDENKMLYTIKKRIKYKIVGKEFNIIYYLPDSKSWENINIPPELLKITNNVKVFHRDLEQSNQSNYLMQQVEQNIIQNMTNIFISFAGRKAGLTEHFFEFLDNNKVISILLSLDDQQSFTRFKMKDGKDSALKDIVSSVDLCLTSTKKSMKKYLVENGRVVYMPEGANIDFFKPLSLEKKYDVVFIGAIYGYRKQLVKHLKNKGINIQTFGYNSDNGSVSFEDMVKILNQSKIVIGHGGIGYSNKAMTLKGRDFEVPMCAVPYITTRYEELADIFKENEEIFFYNTLDELTIKIKNLLSNNKLLEDVHNNLLKNRENMSWKKRFNDIFIKIGLYE